MMGLNTTRLVFSTDLIPVAPPPPAPASFGGFLWRVSAPRSPADDEEPHYNDEGVY